MSYTKNKKILINQTLLKQLTSDYLKIQRKNIPRVYDDFSKKTILENFMQGGWCAG